VKLTTHLQEVPRSRKCGSIHIHSPIRLHGVVLNYVVKHRDNFTFLHFLIIYIDWYRSVLVKGAHFSVSTNSCQEMARTTTCTVLPSTAKCSHLPSTVKASVHYINLVLTNYAIKYLGNVTNVPAHNYNEELHNLHTSRYIKVISSQRMNGVRNTWEVQEI
jgi:hypothetical protein